MPVARPSDSSQATATKPRGLALFAVLLAIRIVNALTLRTFFQPDEFFQSLEPAWQLAFGRDSNAWITWEWKAQLRSSLHPALFAAVYLVAARIADLCGLSPTVRADLLVAAPKLAQAVFAALLDLYTFRLAEKVYGRRGRTAAAAALALSIASPWQWFCSTRTLSNCLETTISSIAVYYWPWHWPAAAESAERDSGHGHQDKRQIASKQAKDLIGPLSHLRLALLLAAFACILRPTNAFIWLVVSFPALWQCSTRLRYVLVREISICGSIVLACSALCDRVYYGGWTFPPVRFLYFNIAQSLAVFYGRNRPDYYLTEGLPLLLTAALPFAVVGLWRALSHAETEVNDKARTVAPGTIDTVPRGILTRLSWACIILTLSLSLISHKEVRFLYPILPFLHVLAAHPLAGFFLEGSHDSSDTSTSSTPRVTSRPPPSLRLTRSPLRRGILLLLLATNVLIAGYVSQVHQRGAIDVVSYLRQAHESRLANTKDTSSPPTTTVGFLMPCHSTPWRSHLVHPSLSAWALTCEPPLDIPLADRSSYLDEADQFYADPARWLRSHMEHPTMVSAASSRSARHWSNLEPAKQAGKGKGRREWPRYLIFFEPLEGVLGEVLGNSRYRECWRGFNSHWHDDWRRKGDVVVWCLD